MKRSMLFTALAVAAIATGLLAMGAAQAQAEQYLVVAQSNDFPGDRLQAVEAAGGEIMKGFPQIGLVVATSADPEFPAKAKSIAGIQSVVPDPIAVPLSDAESMPTESDSKLSPGVNRNADLTRAQWGLQAIQAPAAWEIGVTGRGVRIAVIDSGILTTHRDPAPNLNLTLSKSVVPGEGLRIQPGSQYEHHLRFRRWTGSLATINMAGTGQLI